jgi:hypothetical protein
MPSGADISRGASILWPLLPSAMQGLLLRTCLAPQEEARSAWRKWVRRGGELRALLLRDRWGVKEMLPLLRSSLAQCGAELDKPAQTMLRTAGFREELRLATILRLAGEAADALDAVGVPAIVAGDLAVAVTAYGDPALRHCGGLRLLVFPEQVERAVLCLSARRWTTAGGPSAGGSEVRMVHESQLRLEISQSPLGWPLSSGAQAEARIRAVPREVAGTKLALLAPGNLLASVLEAPLREGSWRRLVWVCDAWKLLSRLCPDDWETFLSAVHRADAHLPAIATLRYLREVAPLEGNVDGALAAAIERLSERAAEEGAPGGSASPPWERRQAVARDCAYAAIQASPWEALWRARGPQKAILVLRAASRPLRMRVRRAAQRWLGRPATAR